MSGVDIVGNIGRGLEGKGGRKERMSREAYLIAPGGHGAKLIHRFLDRLMEERGMKVLESSGLQGSRRWGIVEAPASLAGGSRRSAIQVRFEIDQEWIDLEVVGEQEGFREHDIPARMPRPWSGTPRRTTGPEGGGKSAVSFGRTPRSRGS